MVIPAFPMVGRYRIYDDLACFDDMKRLLFFLGFMSCLALSSCSDGLKSTRGEAVRIRVGVSAGTKATGVSDDDENAISSLQVLTFAAEGELDGYASEAGVSEILVTTFSGVHDIYAVVNSSNDFSGVASKTEFLSYFQDLASQSPDCLVMVGKNEGYEIVSSGTLTIPVHHFVCRVVLGKITNKLIPEALSSKEFRVRDIYLTNVPSGHTLALDDEPSSWFNMMGYQAGAADALLRDAVPAASQVVALNSSLDVEHRFYYIPNLQVEDYFSDTWSPRHTRLVVEASIGGDVFYYPVTLPVSPSNASFEIDNLVIARQGSLRAESVLPYAAVSFETGLSGWTPESENGEFVASHAVVIFSPEGVDPFTLVEEYVSAGYTGNPMIIFGDGTVSPFTYVSRIAQMEVEGGVLFFAEPGLSVWDYVDAWQAAVSSGGRTRVISVDASGVTAFSSEESSLGLDKANLVFEIVTGGTLGFMRVQNPDMTCSLEYRRIGGGSEWESLLNVEIHFDAGEVIELRGWSSTGSFCSSLTKYYHFVTSDGLTFRVRGNLLALTGIERASLSPRNFACLFYGCDGLIQAPELPWMDLTEDCYNRMFQGCTGLTKAPELPATTLAQYCYSSMFQGCTGLTAVPELPASTLASYCYYAMFQGCTGLTSAPELPATTLANFCYAEMFYNCQNLSSVKCLATDISVFNCLYNWLYGVSATGTFKKAAEVSYPSGASGIPSGWTVVSE